MGLLTPLPRPESPCGGYGAKSDDYGSAYALPQSSNLEPEKLILGHAGLVGEFRWWYVDDSEVTTGSRLTPIFAH